MSGTPKPHESAIRSTSIRTNARGRPSPPKRSGSMPVRATRSSKRGVPASCASPCPCRRTIRGGPSNEQSITQMRPFSRRCATVSAPLPTRSRYAISWASSTARLSIGPFGETLTCPPARGAVPTKKTRWRAIHAARRSSMLSRTLAIGSPILRAGAAQEVARDVVGAAAGEVDDLDARQLAQPGELALGVVARAPLQRLDVSGEQLVEAERLARGRRGPGSVRGAHLVDRPRVDHGADARVDPAVQRLAVADEADEAGRVARLGRPEAVGSLRRLQLAELVELQRADDAAAVARVDPRGGPRRAAGQAGVQRLGPGRDELGLQARTQLGRRGRAQAEVGERGAQVQARA